MLRRVLVARAHFHLQHQPQRANHEAVVAVAGAAGLGGIVANNPTVPFFVSDATAVRRPDGRAATATRRRSALAQCAAAPAAERCGEPPAPTSEPAAWMCLRNCGGRFFSRPLLARWRIVASMARASITSET